MILISHRGNLCGPEENDNVPSKIQEAAERFLVEIDVWHIKNQWFLGHDKPEHIVSFEFISHPNFIIHTKNLDALSSLINTDLHYFWHQADDFTENAATGVTCFVSADGTLKYTSTNTSTTSTFKYREIRFL